MDPILTTVKHTESPAPSLLWSLGMVITLVQLSAGGNVAVGRRRVLESTGLLVGGQLVGPATPDGPSVQFVLLLFVVTVKKSPHLSNSSSL
jgi:hypothetical protein